MSSSKVHNDSDGPLRGDLEPRLQHALADCATYGARGRAVMHETHASRVYVCGARAYKVKKPVALDFLDYSTLAKRRAACREEVRVNRELAPGIYLGVRALVSTPDGLRLAPERTPAAVEYAVEMRAFSEHDSLAGMIAAGTLRAAHLAAVGRRLAEFHRRAQRVPGGRPRDVLQMWRANLEELGRCAEAIAPAIAPEPAIAFGAAFVRAHRSEIEQRRRDGLVRDGHGDLRCEHVLVRPRVRVVDRVEFAPRLRRTDVGCDLAFLLMDLEALGQRRAAEQVLSAYRRGGVDAGGAPLLAFYAAHRAFVRAKVALVAADEHGGRKRARRLADAQRMWELGERLCWRARGPLVLLVCGPAASGKSTLAAELARRTDLELVSSDAVRKSAAGVALTDRAPADAYSAGFSRRTYALLASQARSALERSGGVIVEATCRSRADREPLIGLLRGADVRALAVRLSVPLEVALARAAQRSRGATASDATAEIAREQHQTFAELDELEPGMTLRLDGTDALESQIAAVAAAVDRAGSAPPRGARAAIGGRAAR